MNFIRVTTTKQTEHIMMHSFVGRDHQVIGRYEGNIFHDEEFKLKLTRVRGRLWLKNINYTESCCTLTVKEVKRLNDLERYNRKMSRLFNILWQKIDQCTGLFRDTEIHGLCEQYKQAIPIIRKRYCIGE